MSKMQDAMAVPTYRNTEFVTWWGMLNKQLNDAGFADALFGEAKGCYEIGESPSTAAMQIEAERDQ